MINYVFTKILNFMYGINLIPVKMENIYIYLIRFLGDNSLWSNLNKCIKSLTK